MEQYSTNLTDKQWQVIENIINPQERKRKYSLRGIMDAIFYTLKTGCQWRMLPKSFAKPENYVLTRQLSKIFHKKVDFSLIS